jgi:hypothetical protein
VRASPCWSKVSTSCLGKICASTRPQSLPEGFARGFAVRWRR